MEPPTQPAAEPHIPLVVSGPFTAEGLQLEITHPVLGFRVKLKPEQRKTVAELLNIYYGDESINRPAMVRAINASMLGAGKTPMTLYLCALMGLMPVVYCPPAVVPQWESEMQYDRDGNPRNFPLHYYVSNATPSTGPTGLPTYAIIKCNAVTSYSTAILPISRDSMDFPDEDRTVFVNTPITHGLYSTVSTNLSVPGDPINTVAMRIINGLKPMTNPWLTHCRDESYEAIGGDGKPYRQHRYFYNDTGNSSNRRTVPIYDPPLARTRIDPITGVVDDGFPAKTNSRLFYEPNKVFNIVEDAQGVIVELRKPGNNDVTFVTIPIMVVFDEFQRLKNNDTGNNAFASALSHRLSVGGSNFLRGGENISMQSARMCFLSATPFDKESLIFNIVQALGLITTGKKDMVTFFVNTRSYRYDGFMEFVRLCQRIDREATEAYMNTVKEGKSLSPYQAVLAGQNGRPGALDAKAVTAATMDLFCEVVMQKMTALMPTGGDARLNHKMYNGYMRIGINPSNPVDMQRWETYKDAVYVLENLEIRYRENDGRGGGSTDNKAAIMGLINKALFDIEACKMIDLCTIISYITSNIPRSKCVVFLRSVTNIDTLIKLLRDSGIRVAAIMGKQNKSKKGKAVSSGDDGDYYENAPSVDNIMQLGREGLLADDVKRRKAIIEMFTPSRNLRDSQIRTMGYNYRPIQVMIVNITAGSEGINLDDKVGDTPPFQFITSSYNFLNSVQASGRCIRSDSLSPATVFNMYGSSPDSPDTDRTEMPSDSVASGDTSISEDRIIRSIRSKSTTVSRIMGLYEQFNTKLPQSWAVVYIRAMIEARIEEFRQTIPDAFRPWTEEIQKVLSTPAPMMGGGMMGGGMMGGGSTSSNSFGGPAFMGYQSSTSSSKPNDPYSGLFK